MKHVLCVASHVLRTISVVAKQLSDQCLARFDNPEIPKQDLTGFTGFENNEQDLASEIASNLLRQIVAETMAIPEIHSAVIARIEKAGLSK